MSVSFFMLKASDKQSLLALPGGIGSADEAGPQAKRSGATHLLIVTDKVIANLASLTR